eukprot:PhM_4_TR3596/c0_g2_i1/m.35716
MDPFVHRSVDNNNNDDDDDDDDVLDLSEILSNLKRANERSAELSLLASSSSHKDSNNNNNNNNNANPREHLSPPPSSSDLIIMPTSGIVAELPDILVARFGPFAATSSVNKNKMTSEDYLVFDASDSVTPLPMSVLPIPLHLIEPTAAKRALLSHETQQDQQCGAYHHNVSLCPDYQLTSSSSSCTSGIDCDKIHANKDYVIRALTLAHDRTGAYPLTCCAYHNCLFSRSLLSDFASELPTAHHFSLWHLGVEFAIDVQRIAQTVGIDAIASTELEWVVDHSAKGKPPRRVRTTILSMKNVCAQHLRTRCVWGTMCRKVHICRETMSAILHYLVAREDDNSENKKNKWPTFPPPLP